MTPVAVRKDAPGDDRSILQAKLCQMYAEEWFSGARFEDLPEWAKEDIRLQVGI